MFVEDHMTPNPRTVLAEDTLQTARVLMDQYGFRHVPVVDDGGRVVGMVTDRQVRSATGYDQKLGEKLTVAEVMDPHPPTALDEAVGLFVRKHIGALLVMRQDELAGIVTRHDVIGAFFIVLGLDQTGKRVEVALPDVREDLAHAFGALRSSGEDIIAAVVSRMRRDGGEPALYLRVKKTAQRQIERLLRDAALVLLEPEHD
jgi:acetoin utilization protein AcuB